MIPALLLALIIWKGMGPMYRNQEASRPSIGALGLFFYALATVTQATVMDVASAKIQSSTMGIVGIFSQFLTLPSPVIAGVLVTRYGTPSSFIYAGVLTLTAALLLAVIHVPRSQRPTPRTLG